MHLTDTAAIVTGAASGLGAATAQALARQGVHVFGLDLAVDQAPPVDGVTYLATDVTDPEQVAAAVDRAAEGPAPLRTVVTCAGIAPSRRIVGRSGPHDPGLFAAVVRVNLTGTFTVLAAAAERIAHTPPLDDGQRGVVVTTASAAAFDGQIGQAAYAASKGGVVALTLPAARDLADRGIRVNCIAPGIVQTPMMAGFPEEVTRSLAAGVPFPRRLARPDEFAALVLSIVDNDYINGEVIRMDGALRMAPR